MWRLCIILIGIGAIATLLIYLWPPLAEWIQWGNENGKFDSIPGIAINSVGNVSVADYQGGYRIQKFNSDGTFLSACNADITPMAIDSRNDSIYSVNGGIGITKYASSSNTKTAVIGGPAEASAAKPSGYRDIALDSIGDIFVADASNKIIEFNPAGRYVESWTIVPSPDWNATQMN
jgi:hypothetical protein